MFNGTTGKVVADSGANIDDFVLAVDPVSQSTATPVNADTLENHAASYFATASNLSALSTTVNAIQDEIDAIDLSIYAPLASPALTGTPTAPTATSGTSTTQIATTAFVQDAISDKVDVTGDTMTGILTAQNNTSYTTKQVRNVFLSTAEPTSSDGANGDIWIVYTA